ncbi:cupredoxin domain-containing protein [Nesterenkonia lutea]|uniref:Cupredoxin-like copper-binding protein n=1 Tax=Nesterenkonia lutea TaxID=272919 RepID=A0ABR9JBY9_9MICC|nr:hypothetical protein [Nesterenkonia lutea]MBE1523457.1 putative cupredoxin-like copper-binding protein [Nesterenkonia lutea]
MTGTTPRGPLGAGLGLLLLLTASCGQAEPAEALAGTASASAAATSAPATSELLLGLTEWSVETGGITVLAGPVDVRVTNTGGTSHDVVIHGEQGSWATPALDPGETYEMEIFAVEGEELHLVCTLTGHEAQGMHTRIPVVEDVAG